MINPGSLGGSPEISINVPTNPGPSKRLSFWPWLSHPFPRASPGTSLRLHHQQQVVFSTTSGETMLRQFLQSPLFGYVAGRPAGIVYFKIKQRVFILHKSPSLDKFRTYSYSGDPSKSGQPAVFHSQNQIFSQ